MKALNMLKDEMIRVRRQEIEILQKDIEEVEEAYKKEVKRLEENQNEN
jgi:hypothetical protein